jgi:hypothetical protein
MQTAIFAGKRLPALRSADCLPCRRSRVRVPSAALTKAPHIGAFAVFEPARRACAAIAGMAGYEMATRTPPVQHVTGLLQRASEHALHDVDRAGTHVEHLLVDAKRELGVATAQEANARDVAPARPGSPNRDCDQRLVEATLRLDPPYEPSLIVPVGLKGSTRSRGPRNRARLATRLTTPSMRAVSASPHFRDAGAPRAAVAPPGPRPQLVLSEHVGVGRREAPHPRSFREGVPHR